MEFKEEFPHCIAGSTFLVLTITSDEILPNYLLWYLNHALLIVTAQSLLATSHGNSLMAHQRQHRADRLPQEIFVIHY